jgi:hypothetical protein
LTPAQPAKLSRSQRYLRQTGQMIRIYFQPTGTAPEGPASLMRSEVGRWGKGDPQDRRNSGLIWVPLVKGGRGGKRRRATPVQARTRGMHARGAACSNSPQIHPMEESIFRVVAATCIRFDRPGRLLARLMLLAFCRERFIRPPGTSPRIRRWAPGK